MPRRSLRDTLSLRAVDVFDLALIERVLDAIDLALRPIESRAADYDLAIAALRQVALDRINDVLTPAILSVQKVQAKGYLVARSSSSATIALNDVVTLTVDDPDERALFSPSPYVFLARETNVTDHAIGRRIDWSPLGELTVEIIATWGNPGPHADWIISAGAGLAAAQKAMSDQSAADAAQAAAAAVEADASRQAALDHADDAGDAAAAASAFASNAAAAAAAAATFDPALYVLQTALAAALAPLVSQDMLNVALTGKADTSALAQHFRGMQVFTSSGTFTPPAGVSRAMVIVINGGQGGGSGNGTLAGRGGEGGAAGLSFFDLTGDVTVTIGAGGTGATWVSNDGRTSGGASSFGGRTTANTAAAGGFIMAGAAGGTAGGAEVSPGSGGVSGFGGTYGRGGDGLASTGTAGASGAVIVIW